MNKNTLYTLDDYIITKKGEVINKHNNHKLKPQPNGSRTWKQLKRYAELSQNEVIEVKDKKLLR